MPSSVTRSLIHGIVDLFRQTMYSEKLSDFERTKLAVTSGPTVLWVDARCAAETGNRPLFTEDDLNDHPALHAWLHQPMIDQEMDPFARRMMLHAAMVRLSRTFATDSHRRKPDFTVA